MQTTTIKPTTTSLTGNRRNSIIRTGPLRRGQKDNRPRIESASKEPCWRAVYIVGPVWCEKCGRSIKNHCCWERDITHKRAGRFRCVECMPQKVDYR